MSDYEPGEYVKGGKRKHADTPADAVALVFEGYKRVEDKPTQNVGPAPVDEPDEDESNDDAVNGVGTLGTGEVSQDKTPSAPTPTKVFGTRATL